MSSEDNYFPDDDKIDALSPISFSRLPGALSGRLNDHVMPGFLPGQLPICVPGPLPTGLPGLPTGLPGLPIGLPNLPTGLPGQTPGLPGQTPGLPGRLPTGLSGQTPSVPGPLPLPTVPTLPHRPSRSKPSADEMVLGSVSRSTGFSLPHLPSGPRVPSKPMVENVYSPEGTVSAITILTKAIKDMTSVCEKSMECSMETNELIREQNKILSQIVVAMEKQ